MPSPAPYTSPLAQALAPDLLERFMRYVRIDTQSRRERAGSPSTPGSSSSAACWSTSCTPEASTTPRSTATAT